MKKLKIVILFILIMVLIPLIILALKPKNIKIKEYHNDSISFNYSSNYKIMKNDKYIELADENSNIYVDTRAINSVENSNSFASIVDNITYEYLKKNPKSRMVSKYDNYKFDDKSGYRLIFEDNENKTKSLLLITLENLNLSMVTLNANSDVFELMIDSAELIMNSLKIKSNIKYFSLDTIYPKETFEKSDLLVSGDKEINYDLTNAKEYNLKFDNDYEFNVKVPVDFELYEKSAWRVAFRRDDLVIYYVYDALLSPKKYDETIKKYYNSYGGWVTPEGADISGSYDYYGYKKYGEKTYYVALETGESKSGQKLWEYQLSEPITSDNGISTIIATYAYNKITPELVNKILAYDFKYNPTHSKLESGYIVGTLKKEFNDKLVTVEYRIPEKYDITYSYSNFRTIKDNNKNLIADISITSLNPFSDYLKREKNYKLEKMKNVEKNGISFERYVESYVYGFGNYEYYHMTEYYLASLEGQAKLEIEITYPTKVDSYAEFDQDFVDDILNINITTIKNES